MTSRSAFFDPQNTFSEKSDESHANDECVSHTLYDGEELITRCNDEFSYFISASMVPKEKV